MPYVIVQELKVKIFGDKFIYLLADEIEEVVSVYDVASGRHSTYINCENGEFESVEKASTIINRLNKALNKNNHGTKNK